MHAGPARRRGRTSASQILIATQQHGEVRCTEGCSRTWSAAWCGGDGCRGGDGSPDVRAASAAEAPGGDCCTWGKGVVKAGEPRCHTGFQRGEDRVSQSVKRPEQREYEGIHVV
eukprot:6431947-Pyramimonas_sp.AAC.1